MDSIAPINLEFWGKDLNKFVSISIASYVRDHSQVELQHLRTFMRLKV